MRFVLAAPVVAVPLWLIWASWRGRVKIRCCGSDARCDLRMRPAFDDDPLVRPLPRTLTLADAFVSTSSPDAR